MRFTDLILTLPGLAVLLTASVFFGSGDPLRIGLILAFLFWTAVARIVRGLFLSLREKEFVEAAKAAGASDLRIIVRHMLPNCMGPIIVNATLVIAAAILVEAALSFLGFGIQPPNAALGKLISDGQGEGFELWWLVTFPGLVIVIIALCINFVGDGLRDALDPTQHRVRALSSEPILTIRDLTVEFDTEDGVVHAVTGVSYDLHPGEVLGVVGESGSGKSVSMLSVLGLIPVPPGRIVSGEAIFSSEDLLKLPRTGSGRSAAGRSP